MGIINILCEKNLGLLDFPSGYWISRSGSPAGYRSKKLSSTPVSPYIKSANLGKQIKW